MKIGLIGDTHQNFHSAIFSIENLSRYVTRAVILGDVGMFPAFESNDLFIKGVSAAAEKRGLVIYCVRGNHDDPAWWDNQFKLHPIDDDGFVCVTDQFRLAPRVSYFSWDGKNFLQVGGAVSIDKEYRLEQERYGNRPGTLWFPDEQITADDLSRVEYGREVDYLLTHDCSNRTPFRDRLKPDIDSQINRQHIDEILARATPVMHFHGHMHTVYHWTNCYHDRVHDNWQETETIGLNCDGAPQNCGLLDTDTNEFKWIY